jgi:hypothetical protein
MLDTGDERLAAHDVLMCGQVAAELRARGRIAEVLDTLDLGLLDG